MSFLKKHDAEYKKKKVNKKIDSELPFFMTIVTLLATSGFGPYTIFQKIKGMELLPNVRLESINIIKKMGFKYGFTTENRSYQYHKDDFKIPRYAGDYFLNKDFLDLSRNSNCNLYMSIFNRN